MHLIYFTALICISPKTRKPSLTPAPPPQIQSLNICQLIQNISLALSFLCEPAEGGDVNHTWGGGGAWKSTHCRQLSFSLNLRIYRRLFSHQSKLTWFEWLHSDNDIWFTYRWVLWHTHASPRSQGTAQAHRAVYIHPQPSHLTS